MEIGDRIVICADYATTPGARYRRDGEFSGEEFLENHLLPKFEKAVAENHLLLIDLDKVWGYPSSFVSGSFGKLSLMKGPDLILRHIRFKSDDNPIRLEKIINEIKHPHKK